MKAVVIAPLHPLVRQRLEAAVQTIYAGWAVTRPVETPLPDDQEIISLAKDAQIIVTPGELSKQVIDACPALKIIAVARGDPRGVDLDTATKRGIQVVYSAGRNSVAVADLTLAFILMLLRRLVAAHQFVQDGGWKTWEDLFATPLIEGLELSGRTLGLIGYGLIGREVAKRALSFGMHILVYDPYITLKEVVQRGVSLTILPQLLTESDIVSIHCKLTDETRGLIGADEFRLMKKGAYLINTARAAVVDEQALIDALKTEKLSGAALDVYWEEPIPTDSPLLALPNLIHTPHIGGATTEIDLRTGEIIVEDILALLRGEKAKHLANPSD
jgi:D-3-phosphoglycerate dehydrogenase